MHLTSVFYQTHEEANNSDEDRCKHTLRENAHYKLFEEAKEVYIMFALQLMKSYEELRKASIQLDYLYSTVFRFQEFQRFDIQSTAIHLGFFYEIVLSDPTILDAISITYKGLCAHGTRILKITELIASLRQILENKQMFNRIWRQKINSLRVLYDSLDDDDDEDQMCEDIPKSPASMESPDMLDEKDEQNKQQRKRDKNRRKRQKKKFQKLLYNIKFKESEEPQSIEQLSRSTDIQLESVDPTISQIAEESALAACAKLVNNPNTAENHENEKLAKVEPEEPEAEEDQRMKELLRKYANNTKSERIKPNISEKCLIEMKRFLTQRLCAV